MKRVLGEIRADVASARDRDPAARGVGTAEILMNWAGVQAILAHRVAHKTSKKPAFLALRWRSRTPVAPSPGWRFTRRR